MLPRAKSLRALSWLLLALALLLPRPASADGGDGVGLGPVFVYSPLGDAAPAIGWELSGSWAFPAGRAALGGAYPLWGNTRASTQHYVAWEPWFILGATLGAAVDHDVGVRPMYGVWEGVAFPADFRPINTLDDDRLQWVFTISGGWRGVGTKQQLYFTTKLWRMRGVRIFS